MGGDRADATCKGIVISEGSGAFLTEHVAQLGLPRRALSLPLAPGEASDLACFVELWGDLRAVRSVIDAWPRSARAWLVREIVPIAYSRTWPSGERSPGVRLVSTIHRREDLSRDEFERHWRGPHTLVARSYTVPVWNYVQNVVVERLGRDSGEDGFVGMHFQAPEELARRWQAYPEEAARGAEDAAKFMNVDRSISMTASETVWGDANS